MESQIFVQYPKILTANSPNHKKTALEGDYSVEFQLFDWYPEIRNIL